MIDWASKIYELWKIQDLDEVYFEYQLHDYEIFIDGDRKEKKWLQVRVRTHRMRHHINQHKIRSNSKTGNREDVITVKTYKSNDYCYEAQIDGPCKVVYSPDKPLSCGAKVWIETESDVICLSREQINKLKENKC